VLILSAFLSTETRATATLPARRNAVVSALATDAVVFFATPGAHPETSLRQAA
jgi:hypothetical protein